MSPRTHERGCSASCSRTAVAVFGSVARGDDTASSDIDLLVDFLPDASLIDEFRLENELRGFLATEVDVVARAGFKTRDQHIRDAPQTL
jgi:predicted nucleotidyltransferase